MTEQLCEFEFDGRRCELPADHAGDHTITYHLQDEPPPAEAKAAGQFAKGTPERHEAEPGGWYCPRCNVTWWDPGTGTCSSVGDDVGDCDEPLIPIHQALLAAIDARDAVLARVEKALTDRHVELRLERVTEWAKLNCPSSHLSSPDLDCVIVLESIRAALAEIRALRGGEK